MEFWEAWIRWTFWQSCIPATHHLLPLCTESRLPLRSQKQVLADDEAWAKALSLQQSHPGNVAQNVSIQRNRSITEIASDRGFMGCGGLWYSTNNTKCRSGPFAPCYCFRFQWEYGWYFTSAVLYCTNHLIQHLISQNPKFDPSFNMLLTELPIFEYITDSTPQLSMSENFKDSPPLDKGLPLHPMDVMSRLL